MAAGSWDERDDTAGAIELNLMNRAGPHSETRRSTASGYSLVELLLALAISLIILGAAVSVYSGALSSRAREASRTDAITSAQAALNIMSREIGNSGYGLTNQNGLVLADCSGKAVRFRANLVNAGGNSTTSDAGEDVMFYYDSASQSVVRYDRNTGITSGVINRVSDVDFVYTNYDSITGAPSTGSAASNTGKINITLTVSLPDIQGQPSGRQEKVTTDITLRNAPYNLGQY